MLKNTRFFKSLALILLAIFIVSAAACSNNNTTNGNISDTTAENNYSSAANENINNNSTMDDVSLNTSNTLNSATDAVGSSDQSTNTDDGANDIKLDSQNDRVSLTLEDIESYMLEKGVLIGERIRMAAEYVGAIDGFKYEASATEIYEYDLESDEYKALAAGDQIELAGMPGFYVDAIAVNGKFVLMGEPSQDVINRFVSFVAE